MTQVETMHIVKEGPSESSVSMETQSTVNEEGESDVNIMLNTEDPHTMGRNLSEPYALMNFIKGNIGTGVLSMPVVLRYAGLWTGFFMILFAGALATYLMNVLVRTARSVRLKHDLDHSKMDYTEAVFSVFKYGPEKLRKPKGKIKHTVNLFLIVTQLGFCCVYTLFLTENIRYFIQGFRQDSHVNFYLVGFLVCLCLIPMCLWSNMRVFAHLSTLANVATLLGSVLIFAYLFSSGLKPINSLPAITEARGLLIAFSIVMYAFEGISLVLPIENKMATPDRYTHSCGVLNVGMTIIVAWNLAFGFFGYLKFGEDARGSITLNIPQYPYWYSPVKPLFMFAIIISYLLQFYIPATIFTRLMEKLQCHRDGSTRLRYINVKVMRVGLVMFTYLMLVAIPQLDLMISLIGAFASSFLLFILPPVLELVHLWDSRHSIPGFWLSVFTKHMIIILIGLLAFVGGTLATILQLIEAFGKPEQPSTVV